ncbi:GTP-binding protein [Paracoccus sp. S1E-3]|uniref:CobW family GTP-binding protein n=1 Tax=Paracoccus sp. S1E-3 TaxID=2756130 RepID=UPI0015EE3FE5|nr:CobW family GTP-binding protein [Paracoccus sp. S1E-3]MBA4491658.1 GTP-binding protein [Paracoccus sp. S1E-3]
MDAALPVNLLCGYLGAGKTTLLNRLLEQDDQRILVMVNDFGDIAVDATMIAGRSAETIQLSNGCICCSMGGGLFEAFERALALREHVDRLVIEASGVAEPDRLANFARAEPDLDCRAVIAVVDPPSLADRLADPKIGKVVERQIAGADAVFLSRADVADAAAMRQAARLVGGINPLASQHQHLDGGFLTALAARHDANSLSAMGAPGNHQQLFASRTIAVDAVPNAHDLTALLTGHGGAIHRLKGYVQLPGLTQVHLLQLAGGVLSLEPVDAPEGIAINQLVAISPDAGALATLAAEVAASHDIQRRS